MKILHPHAAITTEPFVGTYLPDNRFDAVIGSVPFSVVQLHDPTHNRGRHMVHDHHIIKSLRLTRPGGLVALITTRGTLDHPVESARLDMHDLADLVGAVRMPATDGTDVATDLLIFRRREEGVEPGPADWIDTVAQAVDGKNLRVSKHFARHPGRVLGTLTAKVGRDGHRRICVALDPERGTFAEQLATVLEQIAPVRERAPEAAQVREQPPAAPAIEAPSDARSRVEANFAAIRTLKQLKAEQRVATEQELRVLAQWTDWSQVRELFEGGFEWTAKRDELRELLSAEGFEIAERSATTGPPTPPEYAEHIWRTLERLGFEGGRVLEPGVGTGAFIGPAPPSAQITGVELDPTTATIARVLHPGATIRAESFADTLEPARKFDAVVGSVPISFEQLEDPAHNSRWNATHDHFVLKSLALTRPGGLVALVTDHTTLDDGYMIPRVEMHGLADLVGAVRMPAADGTERATDLLIFRRRETGAEPGPGAWVDSVVQRVGSEKRWISAYFREHPEYVLGTLALEPDADGHQVLRVRPDPARGTISAQLAAALERIAPSRERTPDPDRPTPPEPPASTPGRPASKPEPPASKPDRPAQPTQPLPPAEAPSDPRARVAGNLAAMRTLKQLDAEGRPATEQERQALARWTSWSGLRELFDEQRAEWAAERTELRALLDDHPYVQASQEAALGIRVDRVHAEQIWRALQQLGFEGGNVLEPIGTTSVFVEHAPPTAQVAITECDRTTAAIMAILHPQAATTTESFVQTDLPDDQFDAVVGSVPFVDLRLRDPTHNRAGHKVNDYYIIKSLRLTRPGGLVALMTTRHTLDETLENARLEMHELADLVGAVRMPAADGTGVATDLLIFRRREEGVEPGPANWINTVGRMVDGKRLQINEYFAKHHGDRVLGPLATEVEPDGERVVRVALDPARGTFSEQLAMALDLIARARERAAEPELPAPPPAPQPDRPARPAQPAQPLPPVQTPTGTRGRAKANIAALRVVKMLDAEDRPATEEERAVLARWTGWGAVPQIFDESRADWAGLRTELRELLDDKAYAAARRSTINAHYTDRAYVHEIWKAMQRLDFEDGRGFENRRVLEPGVGSGTFVGLAPPNAQMTGVELDPSTAAIARALHPHATIRTESFADTRFRRGHFDAVVGNVPFANARLVDREHNRPAPGSSKPGRHVMHNHFIIKSLELTRPGGLVALITSSFTMDSADATAREEMHALGELVGAVRMPSSAHREAAGTEVVTDLLIFRRREPGAELEPADWLEARPHMIDGHEKLINAHFIDRPERVLGTLKAGMGMYGPDTLRVESDGTPTATRLAAALAEIAPGEERAITPALTLVPPLAPPERDQTAAEPAALEPVADAELWDGHITAGRNGTFTVRAYGDDIPRAVPKKHANELRALLELRDLAKRLLAVEAATAADTPELASLRSRLKWRYDAYVGQHGPINRFTLQRTGRTDPETGEPLMRRAGAPAVTILRSDPHASLVRALEIFDEATQTASPAKLLTERVIVPRALVLSAETPADALTVCLEQHGEVDLPAIARLLGCDEAAARTGLGELVYDDPATGTLVPASEYLSGNVRIKLDAARAAAETDPALSVNVAALQDVLPPDLGMDEIMPRIGAVWIDAATHQQFLRELLGTDGVVVEHAGGAIWEVKGPSAGVAATQVWGIDKKPAPSIFKALLEQRAIQVYVQAKKGEETRLLDPDATLAAREKADAMQDRFAEWVWEEPERARRLVAEYNRRFNALVLRDYTADGERLTLPGMAPFTPHPHQRTAVARMLAEPAVLLAHAVGAGKTAEMAMGVMELRRLGLVTKPAIVVPNHMLEQFSREWQQLYPQARLLAASSEDLKGTERRAFVARVATHDWDAVIMTRTAFEGIGMSKEAQERYLDTEGEMVRAQLDRAKAEGASMTVKRMERAVLAAAERLKRLLYKLKDPGVSFEQTGIDYLVVDEVHDYKNLRTVSNIQDAAIEGSQRASDLHMKVEYLRSRNGKRVLTIATATPIANKISEAHVIQRYARPDVLRDAGVEDFDSWAA
ncbi:MAG TPA: DEAD/DEAH box helicase family protein, partial [Conexibacter sp.]|nr:DEAD/DEAH box helicase family protein [Conexibacter sp.]